MAEKIDFAGGENQEEVENHVEDTHHDVQSTRYFHVADTTQHCSSQIVHGEKRKGEYEHKEVEGGFGADCISATEPMG